MVVALLLSVLEVSTDNLARAARALQTQSQAHRSPTQVVVGAGVLTKLLLVLAVQVAVVQAALWRATETPVRQTLVVAAAVRVVEFK